MRYSGLLASVLLTAWLCAQPYVTRPRIPLVGDGATDNTAVLNTALANPTQVFVPCGTYLFTSISVTADDVLVVGQGACSVFKPKADSANLFSSNGHTGVAFQNLTFNLANAPNSTVTAGSAAFTNVTITH